MSPSYRVSVIESITGMAEMAKPWNDLLLESRSNSIFLTWEWLYTWSECFLEPDRRLFILLVHKDDELIGVAPWCIRRSRSYGLPMKKVEFLGVPETGSDYLDVFAKRGKEKEVARQIYRHLQSAKSRWDALALQDIPADSLFLLHFLNQADEDGKYAELHPGPYSPSVSLPATVEAFMAQLSPNRRQQFLRHHRILKRSGEVTHRVRPAEEIGPALKEFCRIYERRWGGSEGLFRFLEKFISRSAGEPRIRFDMLSVNGRDIAGLVHLRYGPTLSMYLMGVDHSFDKSISIGNILVGLSIEKGIVDGFSRYDFLRGDEDYKFHWSNDGKRAVHLYLYGRKAAPLSWAAGRFVKAIAKILIR